MKRSNWVLTVGIVGLAPVLTASTGCHKKKPPLNTDMTGAGASNTGAGGATGTGQPNLTAEQMADLIWNEATGVKSVYFDYDSYALRDDSRDTLKHNADVINGAPGPIIQIAGNCDERGTQEYNLALGEKRALAAREYLISLGVPGDRLITVSYGEENPADPGHDESAWAKNRRDDFLKGTPK